jgi:hypothetical protein
MSISTAVTSSFKLWWATLGSVIVFSIVSGLLSLIPVFFQPPVSSMQTVHPLDVKMILIGIVITLINIIPSNAIFAKIIHAGHNTPISTSQALAVGLTKFPQVLWFMCFLVLIFGVPFAGISHFQAMYSVNDPTKLTELAIIALLFLAYFTVFLIIGIYWILTVPIIISENVTFIHAMKKSFSLMKKGWWYTSIVISVPFLVAALAQILLKSMLGKFSIIIGQAIFMPLNVAVIAILFEHHKMRSGTVEPHDKI